MNQRAVNIPSSLRHSATCKNLKKTKKVKEEDSIKRRDGESVLFALYAREDHCCYNSFCLFYF